MVVGCTVPQGILYTGAVLVLQAARGAVVHRLVRQEPVPRHEDILDHQRVAAGAAQAHHMPHVVDAVFGARDQEAAEVNGLAVLDHRAADERPRRMVATRGPVPRPAHEVAAVDDMARTHRRVRRGHPHGRVLAPHLFLRLLVEQREVPVVHADDRADPAGGPACRGDAAHRLVERRRIALQATPLLGLEQLEESDLVEFGHRLVGKPPEILGRLGPLGDQRQEVVDAG